MEFGHGNGSVSHPIPQHSDYVYLKYLPAANTLQLRKHWAGRGTQAQFKLDVGLQTCHMRARVWFELQKIAVIANTGIAG
jgi:hypothetical protein